MKLVTLFCIFFWALSLFASEVLVISEGDLPAMVRSNNDLVKAGQHVVEGLNHKTGSLIRSFVPKASIVGGKESFKYVTNNFTDQPYYGAQVEMNLYNGGRDRVKDNIADVELDKGKSNQKIKIFRQIEVSRKTFWKAVYLKELVQQLKTALEMVKKNKGLAVQRVKGGVATQSDKFEFQIKEVEITQDIERSELLLKKELAHLKNLLGIDLEKTVSLKENLDHNHDWEKFANHSEDVHNYLLEPLALEAEKNHLQASLGFRKWLPKLDAYALWVQNNQRRDFDRLSERDRQQTAFGLRATWDFSDVLQGRVQGKASNAMAQSNRLKHSFMKREVETEIHMELKELKLLDSMIHSAEENIERSKRFFKLISDEYRRGVKTSGDMLFATEKLVNSEIRRMEIVRDLHVAKAHIMVKLGQ